MTQRSVAVIGAGVSGIAAAYYLLKAGHRVALYERDAKIGGRIATERLGDKMVAMGGKNVGGGARLFREFVGDNGNPGFEDFGFNWSREITGNLVPVKPRSFMDLYRNIKAVGVKSLLSFIRLTSLVNKAQGRNDYLDNEDFIKISEECDHQPVSAYFGKGFNEYLLRLLTVRMNGAEPENYHLGNLCSNIGMGRLAEGKVEQLAGDGVDEVLRAFAQSDRLQVRTGAAVEELMIERGGKVAVRVAGGARDPQSYDATVVALTASQSAKLLSATQPSVRAPLEKIRYNPVAIAVAKYRSPVFDQKIKGVSFKSSNVLSNAGVYGLRDPDVVRYTFSGKAALQEVDQASDPEKLVRHAEASLSPHCKVAAQDRVCFVYKYYAEGLCSHAPYHHRIISAVRSALDGFNIELTGDYVKGTSLEACFTASREAVDRILRKTRS